MKKKIPEYEKLSQFIGEWRTEGTVLKNANTAAIEINGIDVYEWLPGKYLLHKADVTIGNKKVKDFEIIHYDKSVEKYIFESYSKSGSKDKMIGILNNGEWLLSGSSKRNRIAFSKDGTVMKGVWEKSDNGFDWSSWMRVQLTKIK